MEFDILHFNGLAPSGCGRRVSRGQHTNEGTRTSTGAFKHDLVVEAQSEFGHARKIALHLYGAEDLGADDVAFGIDEEVDALDDIEKDLVFPIADAFCPPRHGICDCIGGTGLDFEFVGLLGDVSGQTRVRKPNARRKNSATNSWRILLSVVWG